MKKMLSTKEVALLIGVNEKMVYTLIAEKGLPSTKITGKWLFPEHLVEQWVESNTINYPTSAQDLPPYEGVLILAGSNDPLLEKTLTLFNETFNDQIAVFGNLGSMGGIKALKQNLCHMASSHLMSDSTEDYNFDSAGKELEQMPALINFCKREQGIILKKGNPLNIKNVGDLSKKKAVLANRPLGTGTRQLLDKELAAAGIEQTEMKGYAQEFQSHMSVGLEILAGRSDAGIGVRAVAAILDLAFIPLRWERFDLMIQKDRFFDKGVQLFSGLLHEPEFKNIYGPEYGYDLEFSGKMIYPEKS